MSFITRLWPRRLGLVDEQKGLVYSFPMFQHRGAVHEIKIKGVPGVDVLHMNGGTSNMQMGEIFKIRGRKDSRDRNAGHQPALRNQKWLGAIASIARRQVVLLQKFFDGQRRSWCALRPKSFRDGRPGW